MITLSTTHRTRVVPASVTPASVDVLLIPADRPVGEQACIAREHAQPWCGIGTGHLLNRMLVSPMGADQGTGLSIAGFKATGMAPTRGFTTQSSTPFTTRRGPRVRSGTG